MITACRCGGGSCACDGGVTRWQVYNAGGLAHLAYRVGDFAEFRHALLLHRADEEQLAAWQPTAADDLGLQIVDWWAYVADVLTFYTEQIANEAYLGTAVLPESVGRLVGLLGYRPRPGIGAVATLAVLAGRPAPLVIPAGLAVASKASVDVASQTFETSTRTEFDAPTSVAGPTPDDLDEPAVSTGPPDTAAPGTADPPPHQQLLARGGVLVSGTPTALAVGDELLLCAKSWTSPNDPAAVVNVIGLVPEQDAHNRTNTRILLSGTDGLPGGAVAGDYRLARASRTTHLSSVPAGATVVTNSLLVLDATARWLQAGDPLLVRAGDPSGSTDLVRLSGYAEQLWYANAAAATPTTSPGGDAIGIPVLVAALAIAARSGANLAARYGSRVADTTVLAGWTDVGALLDTPVQTLTTLPGSLTLARPPAAAPGAAASALLEDANGVGARLSATPTPGTGQVTVTAADPDVALPTLQPPLRLLWDLVTATRGATVANETLGTGDATTASQDFTLAKSPVTYLSDGASRSGEGYSSTVVLSVGDRYWTEVPMLFGLGPDESVFATYEDDTGKTHVVTGDGTVGARLPTGATVRATYRVGSGAAVPPPGALSQVLSPVPNLRSFRNPVAPAGGADPDPPAQVRTLAPRSVLTFGRAVSADDYAAVAAAAPGVARADAVWEWDAGEQRPTARVYVGDDAGALASATAALRLAADPNRPLLVVAAVTCAASLSFSVEVAADRVAVEVVADVRTAVLGLFAPGVLGLGEPLYRSRIEACACAVAGVLAVHDLRLRWYRADSLLAYLVPFGEPHRYDPGRGGYFALTDSALTICAEDSADD